MGNSLLDVAAGISNPDLSDKGLDKVAQAAPTFAELAAAQMSNPLNPFLNPPTRPAGSNLGSEFSGGNIDNRVLDPSRQGATNAYGTRVSEAEGSPTKPAPFLAGAGTAGVGASLSPERTRLASDDQSRKDQSELLNATAVIDQHNKDLMTKGEDAAQAAITKRETQRTADDAALAQMRTEMQKHADDRTKALEAQAAETRAAKVDPQHWFKERGTVGSLLAAISIGAGAYAAAMPHTASHENYAMKIIDDSIGRDINSQENDIANKWKALNYQGDQNEKEYVRGQYIVNAKRDATIAAYDHASALVTEMRNGTNNQVSISNLDKLQVDLANKKIDLTKEGAAQREAVAIKERAAAAAAAGANPLSATNLNKAYAKYATEAASEHVKNPKAGPILSREEWFKIQQGQGAAGSSALTDKEKAGVKAADYLESSGKAIAKQNVYSNPSNLIGIGANPRRDLDAWNSRMIVSVHATSVGLRSPELVKEITGPFHLSPWDSEATMNQKIANAAKYLRENPPAEEAVPGAKPVGE